MLDDMGHPPFRRFKELYEPLGLRTEERAVLYLKVGMLADAPASHGKACSSNQTFLWNAWVIAMVG